MKKSMLPNLFQNELVVLSQEGLQATRSSLQNFKLYSRPKFYGISRFLETNFEKILANHECK